MSNDIANIKRTVDQTYGSTSTMFSMFKPTTIGKADLELGESVSKVDLADVISAVDTLIIPAIRSAQLGGHVIPGYAVRTCGEAVKGFDAVKALVDVDETAAGRVLRSLLRGVTSKRPAGTLAYAWAIAKTYKAMQASGERCTDNNATVAYSRRGKAGTSISKPINDASRAVAFLIDTRNRLDRVETMVKAIHDKICAE